MDTAITLTQKLRDRSLKCVDLIRDCFLRIQQHDGDIGAFLSTFENDAIAQAEEIDNLFDRGDPLPPLAGIPITIKDNILYSGYETTCASKILETFVAPYDATVVQKIKDQKMIVLGKANMDEFAMGSSTEHSAFKVTSNPWDLQCVPGGSSGGSAAVVSAGFSPLSLGSDTGGSIRQPASFCGVVGLKPTYGAVSRYGLVAFASSLDQIGPFGRTVEDVASLLTVISGHDPLDSTSEPQAPVDYRSFLGQDISGLKIGVPKILLSDTVSDGVKENVMSSLDTLKSMGVSYDLFDMGGFDDALSAYYIIAPAEASANLERYDGVRYGFRTESPENLTKMYKMSRGQGFGEEVKRRIILGTYVLSSGYYDAYYLKAQKVRALVMSQFKDAFQRFDLIITPTTPTVAFRKQAHLADPMAMYLSDIATIPVNLAGLPAISVPCGFSEGLPIGMQLIAPAFQEGRLLSVSHLFQQNTAFHTKLPDLDGGVL